MDSNIIRSIIFLGAGLIVLLLPQHVEKIQMAVFSKLHIKYNKKNYNRSNFRLGVVFIGISVILFTVAIIFYFSSLKSPTVRSRDEVSAALAAQPNGLWQ